MREQAHFLLFEAQPHSLAIAGEVIAKDFPGSLISTVSSLEIYQRMVQEQNFDVVILEWEDQGADPLLLVQELKLKDMEPGVLVLSGMLDSSQVSGIYNSGCQRWLVKEGRWAHELSPALRQIIRIRRLEEENRALMAQITETNILLEEKNKRLDEFVSTVAHDIRGPLGTIMMKIDYVLEKESKNFDERTRTILVRAGASGERLLQLVQGMYEYAKLGARSLKMEPVALTSLVEQVASDLSLDGKRDVKIGVGELPTINGNEPLLRRVFLNLLANAVKYNDKSEVLINVGSAGPLGTSRGTFEQLFVEDNGPGIDQRDVNRIFSMFQRGDETSAESIDGAGIGLAVTRKIIDLHGGFINVVTRQEMLQVPPERLCRGARFMIGFPT